MFKARPHDPLTDGHLLLLLGFVARRYFHVCSPPCTQWRHRQVGCGGWRMAEFTYRGHSDRAVTTLSWQGGQLKVYCHIFLVTNYSDLCGAWSLVSWFPRVEAVGALPDLCLSNGMSAPWPSAAGRPLPGPGFSHCPSTASVGCCREGPAGGLVPPSCGFKVLTHKWDLQNVL